MLGSWYPSPRTSTDGPALSPRQSAERTNARSPQQSINTQTSPRVSTGLSPNPKLGSSTPNSKPAPQSVSHHQPYATPHDEVLGKLLRDGRVGEEGDAARSVRSDVNQSSTSRRDRDKLPSEASPEPPQPVYDPFSGTLLGVLHNPSPPGGTPKKVDDELWKHLAGILELQSDIAGMHVQIEGIASRARTAPAYAVPIPESSSKGRKGKAKPGPKRRSGHWDYMDHGDALEDDVKAGNGSENDTEGGGDEDGDEEVEVDEEAETKQAREKEFARLADKFTGRKDAIDAIMSKLDELSNAVTTFHALQAPTFDFQNPRSRSSSSNTPTNPKSSLDSRHPTPRQTGAPDSYAPLAQPIPIAAAASHLASPLIPSSLPPHPPKSAPAEIIHTGSHPSPPETHATVLPRLTTAPLATHETSETIPQISITESPTSLTPHSS